MTANNFAMAKEIAAWKEHVAENWDSVEVKSVELPNAEINEGFAVGESYKATVTIDGKAIAADLGLDLVVTKAGDGAQHVYKSMEMEVVKREGSLVTFAVNYPVKTSGAYQFGFRLFPKNEKLPHRMDFAYTRWF